jgi:hypothetical protein
MKLYLYMTRIYIYLYTRINIYTYVYIFFCTGWWFYPLVAKTSQEKDVPLSASMLAEGLQDI